MIQSHGNKDLDFLFVAVKNPGILWRAVNSCIYPFGPPAILAYNPQRPYVRWAVMMHSVGQDVWNATVSQHALCCTCCSFGINWSLDSGPNSSSLNALMLWNSFGESAVSCRRRLGGPYTTVSNCKCALTKSCILRLYIQLF